MTFTPVSGHADLISSLDLAAKVALLTGATAVTPDAEPVAPLPDATLPASTWSTQAAYEAGRLLAGEALARGIPVVPGPALDLHRPPLGGRLSGACSEDPLLTGKLAAAYVRGMQDSGVAACLRHPVAEPVTDGHTGDHVADEATLRELYLLPFEIAVEDADPWSIMVADDQVNGVAATGHRHVHGDIVRGEGGYRGLILSDRWATRSAVPAADGGPGPVVPGPVVPGPVMPGPGGSWGDALVAAVRAGEIDEAVVDDHLTRLLLLAERGRAYGSFPAPDGPQRRERLTRLAAQGMTVLRNIGGTLPLERGGTVALIGRHAVQTVATGGGPAQVDPPYRVSVADGLTALLGDAVTVVDGVDVRTRPVPARGGFLVDPRTGEPGVRVTLCDADGRELEQRHSADSTTMVGMDDAFAGPVATARLQGTIAGSGRVELGVTGAGEWVVRAGGHTRAYGLSVSGRTMGEEILAPPARTDVVEVAAGTTLDATVTLPAGPGGSGIALLGLIARPASRETADVIDDAVRAAAAADVAVVVVGLTGEQETEPVDSTTPHLPGAQDALVEAVAGAARRTVVVVNAATPVAMPWLPRVDAVLWAGLPGQEDGHAVAAALLGDIEPAGRLVTTFPAGGRSPVRPASPVGVRAGGTFAGYRGHHAGRAPEPEFWLGHGLGYGRWEYADARLVTGDSPAVTVTVCNSGDRPSREVVQVYFRPAEPGQPVRLVGWEPVTVAPGHSARVTVSTDRRMWRSWNTGAARWDRLSPGGEFLIARGLGDIRATLPIR